MGEVKDFLKYKRQEVAHRPIEQRIHDFRKLDLPLTPDEIRQQAARCIDCGPFYRTSYGDNEIFDFLHRTPYGGFSIPSVRFSIGNRQS